MVWSHLRASAPLISSNCSNTTTCHWTLRCSQFQLASSSNNTSLLIIGYKNAFLTCFNKHMPVLFGFWAYQMQPKIFKCFAEEGVLFCTAIRHLISTTPLYALLQTKNYLAFPSILAIIIVFSIPTTIWFFLPIHHFVVACTDGYLPFYSLIFTKLIKLSWGIFFTSITPQHLYMAATLFSNII